jgi:hypothetical protein
MNQFLTFYVPSIAGVYALRDVLDQRNVSHHQVVPRFIEAN